MFYRLVFLLALVPLAAAQNTRSWEQTRWEDFEKGVAERVSLRSDGKLALAPRFRELYDAPSAYLWALARDSKGNLFAGGGPDARVFKIGAGGNKSVFFQTEGLEIHALAVDRQDNLYAATSPDAKVYRIDPAGRSSLFIDAKVKYVWAMSFNSRGELFLAAGDKGEIHRVDASRRSQLFFKTDESHIRSMLIEKNDDLVIGTDPGGLVIRVRASDASGFVLHQSSKREITALALAADGAIYAAGVGTRGRPLTTPTLPAGPVPTIPAPIPTAAVIQTSQPSAPIPQPLPTPTTLRASVTGGSEVIRIDPDGSPRKVWSSQDDIVYALGFQAAGKLLIGTGNQGRIYQLESDHIHSLLLKASPSQVTAFLQDPGGRVFAATANVGNLYQLGPEMEPEGSFESEVFDARTHSRWGRLHWKGTVPTGTSVSLQTRSGNLSTPAAHWSPWSTPITTPEGRLVESPPARFAQWKAVLRTNGAASPLLDSATLAYQPNNIAPAITEIEITPPNYRFPAPPAAPASASQTITLQALGTRPSQRLASSAQPTRTMNQAKGYLGVRWLAQDENEDELVFKVEIRGAQEQNWNLLGDDIEELYLSWDSTAFADGLYLVRVTVSDSPSNPAPERLYYVLSSEPFYIDNTPPLVSSLTAAGEGSRLRVRFHVADSLTHIAKSEYAIDGGDWRPMLPVTRLLDSRELDYDFLTEDVKPGEHTVAIRIWDANDNLAAAKTVVR